MNIRIRTKCCVVPQCTNTSVRTPEKLFIYGPHTENIRKKWLELAQIDPTYFSNKTSIYFCEDHFDLPNDMQNYIEYKLMGSVRKIRMKPGSLPSKFVHQRDRRKRTARSVASKRQRISLIEECGRVLEESKPVAVQRTQSIPLAHDSPDGSSATGKKSADHTKEYFKSIKVQKTGKTNSERAKEYRKRQRALKPAKVPKTGAQRTREWRARIANGILASQQEQSASKTVLQCRTKGMKQMNVENSETVDGCRIVKISCKRTGSVTCEKQNNGKFVKQMNVKCLKTIDDCAGRFMEKDNVQNVSDNKIILEIADPNNILSNLHDLKDKYSAVIKQIIDKNDVKTQDTSEQMNNEANIILFGKLQETGDDETVLPDVEQKNIKNERTVDSEIGICEFKIKMEESETDVMNIKLEAEDEEAFLSHIKQEQVDGYLFERGDKVYEKEMKLEHSVFDAHFETGTIKLEPVEGSDELCLAQVKQEFTD